MPKPPPKKPLPDRWPWPECVAVIVLLSGILLYAMAVAYYLAR